MSWILVNHKIKMILIMRFLKKKNIKVKKIN